MITADRAVNSRHTIPGIGSSNAESNFQISWTDIMGKHTLPFNRTPCPVQWSRVARCLSQEYIVVILAGNDIAGEEMGIVYNTITLFTILNERKSFVQAYVSWLAQQSQRVVLPAKHR